MLGKKDLFIPVMTTSAGLCLTADDCTHLGVQALSYHLDALLIRPGIAVLNALPNLASYVGWSGPLLLNAANLNVNKAGMVVIRSPYDGSRLSFTMDQIMDCIRHLDVDWVIFPDGHPVQQTLPPFVESDTPAHDGMEGRVYAEEGVYDITRADAAMVFEPIEANCGCPTCSQGLTIAYLHHLYAHTPLLCQRFLVQHNVFHAVKSYLLS